MDRKNKDNCEPFQNDESIMNIQNVGSENPVPPRKNARARLGWCYSRTRRLPVDVVQEG